MSSRPTHMQIETLVEFLEQNPGIAKGLLRTNSSKLETKKKWEYIAVTLNSLGGANKTGQGWAKYWAEKKCALKKHYARHAASMRRSDGGPASNLPELSPLDKRLVAVIGDQIAIGDSRLPVDPVSQSSQEVKSTPPHSSEPLTEDNNFEAEVIKQEVNSPTSSIAGSSRGEQTDTPPSPTISEPQQKPVLRRPRRCAKRKYDDDMDRLAQIEERRVDAETVTAHAFADMAATLKRNVVAIENISNAMSQIATGLEGLSAVANAILVMANVMQQR